MWGIMPKTVIEQDGQIEAFMSEELDNAEDRFNSIDGFILVSEQPKKLKLYLGNMKDLAFKENVFQIKKLVPSLLVEMGRMDEALEKLKISRNKY